MCCLIWYAFVRVPFLDAFQTPWRNRPRTSLKTWWTSSKWPSGECVAPPHPPCPHLPPPPPPRPPRKKNRGAGLDTEGGGRRGRASREEGLEEEPEDGGQGERPREEAKAVCSNRSTSMWRTSAWATAPARKWYSGTAPDPAGSQRPTTTKSFTTSSTTRGFPLKTHPLRLAVDQQRLTMTSRFWTTTSSTTPWGSILPGSVVVCRERELLSGCSFTFTATLLRVFLLTHLTVGKHSGNVGPYGTWRGHRFYSEAINLLFLQYSYNSLHLCHHMFREILNLSMETQPKRLKSIRPNGCFGRRSPVYCMENVIHIWNVFMKSWIY